MISIVIPVHNRLELTRQCLLSLRKQHASRPFEIIVVDDGSTDGTAKVLAEEFPEVSVVPGTGNLFWAGGVNRGIEYALSRFPATDAVLLMNNDTMLSDQFIGSLAESSLSYPEALLGSVFIQDDSRSTVIDGGVKISWPSARFTVSHEGKPYREIDLETSPIAKVDFLSGRGMLIPVAVFRTIGLLDDRHLPHYGADYEFSWRASMAGFRLLIDYRCPVISLEHVYPRRFRFRDLISIRSADNLYRRFQFARRCCPSHFLPSFMVFDFCRVVAGSFLNRP